MKRFFLFLFFIFSISICFSEKAEECLRYKFHEGQIISYKLVMDITSSTRKNFENPKITSKHLFARITEKVEKQVSTDSFQIFYLYDLLSDNGEAPWNYHTRCNRLQVKENGLLLDCKQAGYSWLEFKIGSSILFLIDPQSPNFGYVFPINAFDLSKPFSEIGRSHNFPTDTIVRISPKMKAKGFFQFDYDFSSASRTSEIFSSGNGSVLFSLEKGLIFKNEGRVQSEFNFIASDSFKTTVIGSFSLELNKD